jgi:sec-independent protein translocase protein TatA
MFGLGAGEILLIGIIALLFVGPKKIPELAKSFGKAIREFQDAKEDVSDSIRKEKTPVALEDSKKDS